MSGSSIRIIDMPDLGTVDDTSSVVGERAGSGRFQAAALKSYVLASSPAPTPTSDVGRNRLHNAGFRILQRSFTSGTALAAGAYGHDRWKAGSGGCTYTFSPTPPATTIVITAGSLQQIVETIDVEGGTYTLSWSGSAQGRINGGAYAASPVTASSLPANNAITVEFTGGTLGMPQLEPGATATPFEHIGMQQDLARCQRFYQSGQLAAWGWGGAIGMQMVETIPLMVTMRAPPACALSTPSANVNVSSPSLTALAGGSTLQISVTATAIGSIAYTNTYTASSDL